MPLDLSFIIPGQLAGMAKPGGPGSYLQADLARLREQGIGVLVSLTLEPPDRVAIEAAGLELLHLPVPDFAAPADEQIDRFVALVREQLPAGRAVGVHCGAGLGRTGTLLACYLVFLGEGAEEAMDSVRRIRPRSIETPEQEACVRAYDKRLRSGRKPKKRKRK